MSDLFRSEGAKLDSPYRDIITENMKLRCVRPKERTAGILKKGLEEEAALGAK